MLTRDSGLCEAYVNGRLTEPLSGLRFDSGRFTYLASGLTGLIHLPAAAGQ
nr:MAG TPA: hypothetical protein [Caudoviricetes sp.]